MFDSNRDPMCGIGGRTTLIASMGSITVAGWIAYVVFWILLIYGWVIDELHGPAITTFLVLWIGVRFGLPYLNADGFFITCVAILDIALVFLIFKADIPLT
jgi:hypothetical protein